jgi:hypothetical protein
MKYSSATRKEKAASGNEAQEKEKEDDKTPEDLMANS